MRNRLSMKTIMMVLTTLIILTCCVGMSSKAAYVSNINVSIKSGGSTSSTGYAVYADGWSSLTSGWIKAELQSTYVTNGVAYGPQVRGYGTLKSNTSFYSIPKSSIKAAALHN